MLGKPACLPGSHRNMGRGVSMVPNSNCGKLLAVALLFTSASPAQGASAAKEIAGYNKIKVELTKNAKKCGFESPETFEKYLRKDLEAIGLTQYSQSIVEISLEVGGVAYGALETQCAIDVNLDLRTTLTAANINTNNQAVRQAVDRLGAFPVSLYEVGAFAVSTTLYTVYDNRNITKAESEVINIIQRLVKRFEDERRK
jgi:hypothetical protein